MPGGLLGTKLGMTQVFDKAGNCIPVTVLRLGPCTVVQKKSKDSDGYTAVQIGYQEVSEKKVTKPLLGHFTSKQLKPLRYLREFRIEDESLFQTGQTLSVNLLQVGDVVDVTGTSKGKGFQGVIKRHGLAGGPAAHGSRFHRTTGSIGQRTSPGEVKKGAKLPGRMGFGRVTTRHLKVVGVRPEEHLVLMGGAVPGPNGGLVFVRLARRTLEQRLRESRHQSRGCG